MNRYAPLALTVLGVLPLLAGGQQALARSDIGVAAAVNQQAERTPPGAAPRTVVLGDTLIFKERIRTQGEGLVQILLRDGSTFTVGANSDLVIDEFVYDPQAGSGKLVASFGKGVARFVGGKLSKKPGGVTVKTPVGTIGIRGGIANIEVGGGTGQFSLLFGDELSFLGPNGATRRIFERGYTLSVNPGAGGSRIRPTTSGDISSVQRQLSGAPGQSGGSNNPPSDRQVGNSPVGSVNSRRGVSNARPQPKPKVVAASNLHDGDRILGDIARDTNRPTGDAGSTLSVRVLSSGESYEPAGTGATVTTPGAQDLLGGTPETDRSVVFTVDAGRTQMTGTIDGETVTMPLPSGGEAVFRAVTSTGRTVTGSVFRNGDHFVAFTYFEEISTSVLALDHPVFGFGGVPTDLASFEAANDYAQVRSYTLTSNPMHSFRTGSTHALYFLNPLAADKLGTAFLDNVKTSDLLVIGTDAFENEDPRYLVAAMNIQGEGTDQKSAVSLSTGRIEGDPVGGYVLTGSRRGGVRADSADAGVLYDGPVTSLADPNGAHFFGDNADNFVIGANFGGLGDDVGADTSVLGTSPYADASETYSGYVHVADLQSTSPAGEFVRTDRSLSGYASGMVESTATGGTPVPMWSNTPGDLRLSFNAADASAGAMLTLNDNTGLSPHLQSLTIGFGNNLNESGADGSSAFVDNDRYALSQNFAATTAEIAGVGEVGHAPSGEPRSYMMPSTLVDGGDDALFHTATRCTCAFLEWGYWGTSFEADSSVAGVGATKDFVHLGTWAAGDTPTFGQLPLAGSATYTGHAVGTVASGSPSNPSQYLAAGDFSMTYGFASRTGTASITGFDGRDFSGTVAQPGGVSASATNRFTGSLGQVGVPTGTGASGTLNGSFVRGPQGPVQGVIGGFGLSDPTNNWSATGVVVGQGVSGVALGE
uniref:FecR domain-containing protein n=1 Tax=Stappia sp. TaxID=1870903 RepID=UPI003BAC7892